MTKVSGKQKCNHFVVREFGSLFRYGLPAFKIAVTVWAISHLCSIEESNRAGGADCHQPLPSMVLQAIPKREFASAFPVRVPYLHRRFQMSSPPVSGQVKMHHFWSFENASLLVAAGCAVGSSFRSSAAAGYVRTVPSEFTISWTASMRCWWASPRSFSCHSSVRSSK
jgi:hypothetical protein